MAGSITVLPARRTGSQEFAETFTPYLQYAFQMMLKKKMEEQQRQQALRELGIGKDILTPAGEKYAAGQLRTIEEGAPVQATMPQIPKKYYKTILDITKAQQLPVTMDMGGGIQYKSPQVDPYTAMIMQRLGLGQPQPTEQPTEQPTIQPELEVTEVSIGAGKPRVTYGEPEAKKAERQITIAAKKDAIVRLGKLEELLPVIEHFDNLISTIPVGTGTSGLIGGYGKRFAGAIGADPFARTIRAELKGLRPQIVRGMGDVGNLNIVEQEAGEKLMPSEIDPDDTRVLKSIAFRNFLIEKIKNVIKKSGLENEPRYQNYINQMQQGIQRKIQEAITMGISQEKINQFIGRNIQQPQQQYIRTGIDNATGKRIGMLPDGTIEEIQ